MFLPESLVPQADFAVPFFAGPAVSHNNDIFFLFHLLYLTNLQAQ
jgi:hypothetical protein